MLFFLKLFINTSVTWPLS